MVYKSEELQFYAISCYHSGPMSYDMQGQRFCLDKKKTEIEPKEGIFVDE